MKKINNSSPSTEDSFKDMKKLQAEVQEMLKERLKTTAPLTKKKQQPQSNGLSQEALIAWKNFENSTLVVCSTIMIAIFFYLAITPSPAQHLFIILLFLEIFSMICTFYFPATLESLKEISKLYTWLARFCIVLIAFSIVVTENFLCLGDSITSVFPILGSVAENTLGFTIGVIQELMMLFSIVIH